MNTTKPADRAQRWAMRAATAIPGTGVGYRVRIRRHIATTQEIREACGLAADESADVYGIRVRGKRRAPRLPDYRDDPYRGDRRDRSWKRHRATQWREVQ